MRTDKEILEGYHRWEEPISKIEGTIKEVEIGENGVWLAFMIEYLAAADAAGQAGCKIVETVQEIDVRVYELYGLGDGAMQVVESGDLSVG